MYGQPGGQTPALQINGLSLMIPTYKPSVGISAKLSSLMAQTGKFEFLFPDWTMHQRTFTQSVGAETQFLLTGVVNRPLRVIVGFKCGLRLSAYQYNAGQFDDMNINTISLKINGYEFPRTPYNLYNAAAEDGARVCNYPRVLQDIYNSAGVSQDTSTGLLLNADNWRWYSLFVFDTSALPSNIFESTGRSNSQITIQWTQSDTFAINGADAASYTCYALLESERKVSYDLLRDEMQFTV